MSGSLLRFLLFVALVGTASADLVLGTFDTPAADSAAVRKLYSAEAFSNPASRRGLSVGEDGALTLRATLAGEPSGLYSARAGIVIPLNGLWAPMDLREATAVTFRIQGSSAYTVHFSLGSDVYRNGEDGVVQVAPVQVTRDWARHSIALAPTSALGWLDWMEEVERFPEGTVASVVMDSADPRYGDPELNVAMNVKNIQFLIVPTWVDASTWSAPEPGATGLSVDDIVVVGMGSEKYPLVQGRGCDAGRPSVVLSSNRYQTNEDGLPWRPYADSERVGLSGGTSRIVTPSEGWSSIVDTSARRIRLVADLSRPGNHLDAGFAGIEFQTPLDLFLDLTGAVAVGFSLSIPPGASIDSNLVLGVLFKMRRSGSGAYDPSPYQVLVPVSQFRTGTASICVDLLEDLRTPEGRLDPVNTANQGRPLPTDLAHITGFAWEVRMLVAGIHDSVVLRQGFELGPVILHGRKDLPEMNCIWGGSSPGGLQAANLFCTDAVRKRERPGSIGFHASGNGWVELSGLEGSRRVDVFTASGVRVASFEPGSIPRLRVERGAYHLVASREGGPALVRTVVLAR